MNSEKCGQFRRHCNLAKAELRKLHEIVNIANTPSMITSLNRHQLAKNIAIVETDYTEVWNTGCHLREAIISLILTLNSLRSELWQQQTSAPLVSSETSANPILRPVEDISGPVTSSISSLSKEVSPFSGTSASLIPLPLPQTENYAIKIEEDNVNKKVNNAPMKNINDPPTSINSKLEGSSMYNCAAETSDAIMSRVCRKRVYEKIVEEVLNPAKVSFKKKLTNLTQIGAQNMQNKHPDQQVFELDNKFSISAPSSKVLSNSVPTEETGAGTLSNVQFFNKECSLADGVSIQNQHNFPLFPSYYAQDGVMSSPLVMASVPIATAIMLSSTPSKHFSTSLSTSNTAISVVGISAAPHLQSPVINVQRPICGLTGKTPFDAIDTDLTGETWAQHLQSTAFSSIWLSGETLENRKEDTDCTQAQFTSSTDVCYPDIVTYYKRSDWPVGNEWTINHQSRICLETPAVGPTISSSPQSNQPQSCPHCGEVLPGFPAFPDPQFFLRGGLPLPYHQLGSRSAEWPTAFYASVCGAAPQTVYLDRHGMVSIYGGRDLSFDVQRTQLNTVHQVFYPWKGNGTPYSFQYETIISISFGNVITCNQKVGLVRTLQQGLVLGRDFAEAHTVWVEKVDSSSGWIHIDGHSFPCYRAKKAYKSLLCQ